MPNLLLIYPTQVSEAPMTLAMLSAVAKEEGWNTRAVVNTFKKPLTTMDIIKEAEKYKADLVAVSMITFDVLTTYYLLAGLRGAGFKTVVGGAHPTDCPEEAKEWADIVVQGEGENALRRILRAYPRLSYGVMDRESPIDLKTLPKPDLDVFDKELFTDENGFIKGFHRIYTSRGCPGCCTFCDWQVFKQNFREYSLETIIETIKERIEMYGITTFSIADDCFTLNRQKVMDFCEAVKPLDITWRANSRANLVDLEMLKAMKDSGCHSIAFGLESGDPETLKKIKKGVTLLDNEKAVLLAHQAGLEVYGCMMTGFPWETPENVENNIKFMEHVWDEVSLFQVSGSLMPFPGSEIYKEYNREYGFNRYWIDRDRQKAGIQVYQNAENPLAVSTFYQRYLFDDTYIQEDYFFKYPKKYKKAVKKMVFTIGRHNLEFMYPGQWFKQKGILFVSWLSMMLYEDFPKLEKWIGGKLFKGKSNIETLRDKRRGIVKNYGNPN